MYTNKPWTLNEQSSQVKVKQKSTRKKTKSYYKVSKVKKVNRKTCKKKIVTFKFFRWTISIKG